MPETQCLAETGATFPFLLVIVAALLVAVGVGVALVAHHRHRALTLSAGVMLALAALAGLATMTAPPSQADAAGDPCAPAQVVAQPAPPPAPVPAPPAATPTPTPPVVIAVQCPAGNDLSTLPAGDSIVWVPVTTPDPRDQPGTVDEVVLVYTNNISGYTWHIVRASDGTESTECAGQPTDGGVCVGNPGVSFASYVWEETDGVGSWVATGGSGGTNGCGGGGGNN